MNILVTGVAGFIGFSLAKNFLNKKNRIFGVDSFDEYYSKKYKQERVKELKKYDCFYFSKIDICNRKKLKSFISNKKINLIIHMAAQAGVRYSYINPKKYVNVNILGFLNLIEISKELKIKKIVYASSSSVYGDNKKFPLSENTNCKPKNIYSVSKKLNEDMADLYNKLFKINFIGLRFFTIYGEWGRPDMLIFKIFKSNIKGNKLYLNNHGNHYRDFTYIDDAVKIVDKLIRKKITGSKIFNICSNKPQNILKLINNFKKKNKLNIKMTPLHKADVIKTHGNNSKIKKLLTNIKFTNFNKGFDMTYKWYKKYYEKII